MNKLNNNSKQKYQISKVKIIFKLYIYISITLCVISGIYLLTTFLPASLSDKQQPIFIIFAIAGIVASVSATIIAWIDAKQNLNLAKQIEIKHNAKKEMEIIHDAATQILPNDNRIIFLELFIFFERIAKKVLNEHDSKNDFLSYRKIINGLSENNIITSEDVIVLDELLKIRNAIAHGDKSKVDSNIDENYLIDKGCDQLLAIIKKISD
ncbi:hypothetical protein AB7102_00865 [Providencia manganoxydans]|uniref:hypothetical protein n=1 Tax=Providencia manganoxydans TaxID=2923283 RepID=UPI0034E4307C